MIASPTVVHIDFLPPAHATQDGGPEPLRTQKVLARVRRVMDSHAILLPDLGADKMWIARHYYCHEPNTCLIFNGFCSMGFTMPGAIHRSASAIRTG